MASPNQDQVSNSTQVRSTVNTGRPAYIFGSSFISFKAMMEMYAAYIEAMCDWAKTQMVMNTTQGEIYKKLADDTKLGLVNQSNTIIFQAAGTAAGLAAPIGQLTGGIKASRATEASNTFRSSSADLNNSVQGYKNIGAAGRVGDLADISTPRGQAAADFAKTLRNNGGQAALKAGAVDPVTGKKTGGGVTDVEKEFEHTMPSGEKVKISMQDVLDVSLDAGGVKGADFEKVQSKIGKISNQASVDFNSDQKTQEQNFQLWSVGGQMIGTGLQSGMKIGESIETRYQADNQYDQKLDENVAQQTKQAHDAASQSKDKMADNEKAVWAVEDSLRRGDTMAQPV